MNLEDIMSWVIGGGILLLVIGIFIFASHLEKKRIAALSAEAAAAGLALTVGRNYALVSQFGVLNALDDGENRYAETVIDGTYNGNAVLCFDFHYETYSTDSKGNRQTNHHWHHVYSLTLPKRFPELRIGRENIFTKIGKVFGYPSIDFESAEFSRTFLVQSRDKKFAYDVCHPRMMEFLLANKDLTLELDGTILAAIFSYKMKAGELAPNLDRLVEFRDKIPEYLFEPV